MEQGFGPREQHRSYEVLHHLGLIIALLAGLSSVTGILSPSVYRADSAFVAAGWRGNDLVTLVIAVPILLLATFRSGRRSRAARLVFAGMMGFTIYNFSFYLFGAAFNGLFPAYAALFTLGLIGLMLVLFSIDREGVKPPSAIPRGARWIALFMSITGGGLGVLWMQDWARFVLRGVRPPLLDRVGAEVHVTAALDLSMVVPVMLIAAWRLWKGRSWGLELSVMINVKGAVYALVLVAASVSAFTSGIRDALALVPLWAVLAIGHGTASLLLVPYTRRSAADCVAGKSVPGSRGD